MTTLSQSVPRFRNVDLSELTHLFCGTCDDDTALCGYRTGGWEEVDDDEGEVCRLCTEMEEWPCPRCGDV